MKVSSEIKSGNKAIANIDNNRVESQDIHGHGIFD